jgi:hypothetical protein
VEAARRRPKDEQDFDMSIGGLNDDQRRWLSEAVATAYGGQHPWQSRLTATAAGRAE